MSAHPVRYKLVTMVMMMCVCGVLTTCNNVFLLHGEQEVSFIEQYLILSPLYVFQISFSLIHHVGKLPQNYLGNFVRVFSVMNYNSPCLISYAATHVPINCDHTKLSTTFTLQNCAESWVFNSIIHLLLTSTITAMHVCTKTESGSSQVYTVD